MILGQLRDLIRRQKLSDQFEAIVRKVTSVDRKEVTSDFEIDDECVASEGGLREAALFHIWHNGIKEDLVVAERSIKMIFEYGQDGITDEISKIWEMGIKERLNETSDALGGLIKRGDLNYEEARGLWNSLSDYRMDPSC